MTHTEKFEIIIILISGLSVFFMTSMFPKDVEVGRLLLNASALLLFQSLVRDLWLLSRNKDTDIAKPQRKIRCMCVESTVGVLGVMIGLMLLGLGVDRSVAMVGWAWAFLVVVVLAIGFCVKDYVLEWSPWRIYCDKDHKNIIVSWKEK